MENLKSYNLNQFNPNELYKDWNEIIQEGLDIKKKYDEHWNLINEEYHENEELIMSHKYSQQNLPSSSVIIYVPQPFEITESNIINGGKKKIFKRSTSTKLENSCEEFIIEYNAKGDFATSYFKNTISDTLEKKCDYENIYSADGHLLKQICLNYIENRKYIKEISYALY